MVIFHSYVSLPEGKFNHMGLSENSVPLNPMVLMIIIPFLNGYNWRYTPFSDKPIFHQPELFGHLG